MTDYIFPATDIPTLLPNSSPLVNRLLVNRGIETTAAAESFLKVDYDSQLEDPNKLHHIDIAVERIIEAINNNQKIAIFSDYDCDGIPGAVVLHDCFKRIGYTGFINYIPHRHFEGFGLSTAAVDTLRKDDVQLIVTIDCGTSDVAAITYANEQGIDVIVTDHHEPGTTLPPAVAIVNPKLGDYPFTELCGAAVVFKLAQVILEKGEYDVAPGWEKWWLDMVGIATIADMVPLVGENRVFAHYGLQVLRKSRRPGLQQLLHKAKANQQHLTEEDVGFTIGPRINAASRMDSPEDAFYMLAETDVVAAGARVDHLEKLNQERKTMVALMTKDVHVRLKHLEEIPPVIVLGNPDWRPSLVGLAANKLAEEYNRPAFLWGKDGNGVFKGSCRSGGAVSVVSLMQAATEVFLEHGGHHFSGGFSVKEEHIHTFGETLNQALKDLGTKAAIKEDTPIDEILSLDDVTASLIRDLNQLAPYGVGNRRPLFAFKAVSPRRVDLFGKAKEHLKLTFENTAGTLEAIAFFATPKDFAKNPETEKIFTLIGHVEQSFFMGRQQIRVRIVDII